MPNGNNEDWRKIIFEEQEPLPPQPPVPSEVHAGTRGWAITRGKEEPRYPPYPLEDTETGEMVEGKLLPDNTVWVGEEQVGIHNPQTGEFEERRLSWADIIRGTPRETAVGLIERGVTPQPTIPKLEAAAELPKLVGRGIMETMGIRPKPGETWEEWRGEPAVTLPEFTKSWLDIIREPERKGKPWKLGMRGVMEEAPALPIYLVGGRGVPQMTKLFRKVAKIEAKQTAGKAITTAEKATLEKATAIEAEIGKVLTPKMPTIEELVAANYDPNVAARLGQRFAKLPVARSLLPMQAAKTDAEKATIAWMGQRDIAPSLARIEMEAVYAKDVPFKLEPSLAITKKFELLVSKEPGKVLNVVPKKPEYKPYVQAVHEFPDRYILTEAQRAEIDLLSGILERQLAMELAAGVAVRPVGLKPGQRYFPRFVREIVDLETKAVKEVKGGVRTRPGLRPSSFRERYYEEVLDGIVKGKRYTTDMRAAVEMRITAGNKAISDKMLADYLKPMGRLPKETIKLETRLAKEKVVAQRSALKQISELIEHINAKAKINWYKWLGIKKQYPEQYATLRAISKAGDKVPNTLTKFIVAEKKNLTDISKGIITTYRQEMKWAKKPILGQEGSINHAALQGRLFPVDIAEPTNALIRGEITRHQVLGQWARVNDVARMGQTAIDTGPGLIQGQLLLFNDPKAWAKMWEISLKTLWNSKHRARYGLANKAIETEMATHGAAPFGSSEFTLAARPGGWLSGVPGFQRFGKFFEALIDTGRIEIYKAEKMLAMHKLGRELTAREMTDLVVTSDHMMGVSSMARLGMSSFLRVLGRDVAYAPRYYLAFVSFLGRAFQGGIGGDMARRVLPRWLFGSGCFMSAMAIALGQKDRIIPTKDKPLPKMFDPTSGEFYTVEVGGVHIGLGGIYVAGLRLLASLVKTAADDPSEFASIDPHENPVLRYGYGRASPSISAAIDVVTGHNYLGERLDTPQDYLHEVVDKTFPFWLAGQITDVPKAGWGKGLAEWWGLRAWMVQYRELAREYAETHIKDIPQEMIMPWQQEKVAGGAPLTYDDLNNEQRAWLLLTYQDYREMDEKRKERQKETGTDFQVADIEVREMIDTAYRADLEDIASNVVIGNASIADYQSQAEYLRRANYGGLYFYREEMEKRVDPDRYEDLQRWIEEKTKPEDEAYDKYMELRGEPPKVAGKPDWDAWKKQMDDYLESLDPPTREYIERRQDDWINKLPENAQRVERLILECETILDNYYMVPEGIYRVRWREGNPKADARLFILGRVTTLKSVLAIGEAMSLAKENELTLTAEQTENLMKVGRLRR